jgi:crossover junction endodeoxyribonuclease RuvC
LATNEVYYFHMRIIAIDPGFERVGIAIVEKEQGKKETVVFSECFKTAKTLSLPERLTLIGKEITSIIEEYKPERMAIESLFFMEKNRKSAIAVAEARGVILYEGAKANLPIYEYTPMQIKVAVTGHGASDKKQVIFMTEKLVTLEKKVSSDDEMDAIAIGVTCLASER